MGWSKSKVLDTGHELGYCEISKAVLDIGSNKLDISVNWYKDEAAKNSGLRPFEFNYIITPDQAELFEEVVAHLETKAQSAQDAEVAEEE